MIPQKQLKHLKPIQDQVNRTIGIKKKSNLHNAKKLNLTKKQRRYSIFPSGSVLNKQKGDGPRNYRKYRLENE